MTPIQLARLNLAAWLAQQAEALARLQGRPAANDPQMKDKQG